MRELNRRYFLWTGIGLSVPRPVSARMNNETVYQFSTPGCDVLMSVEFYDRYSARGFSFEERHTDHKYCLSREGDEGRNCLAGFSGSLAIARYRIRPLSYPPKGQSLREHVRTIDQDRRLSDRPPFERTLTLQGGLASDIQAFGVERDESPEAPGSHEPWCLFRQDLYFDAEAVPFLVVHWKHTLSAIRLVDVIPGEQTKLIE